MKEKIDPLIDERAPWLKCLDLGNADLEETFRWPSYIKW